MQMLFKKITKVSVVSTMSLCLLLPSFASANSVKSDELTKIRSAVETVTQKESRKTQREAKIKRVESEVKKDPILDEAPNFFKSIEGRSYEELNLRRLLQRNI